MNPSIALDRLNQLLHAWSSGDESPAAAYGATHAILFNLRKSIKNAHNYDVLNGMLDKVEEHTNSMFHADSDRNMSFKEHLTNALIIIAEVESSIT